MVQMRSLAGTVEIDGLKYEWQLQREPQFTGDGWKGMTVSLRQIDAQREALLEFPTPKRLLKGLPKGRSQINDAIAARAFARHCRRGGSRHPAASRWSSW